MNKPPLVSRRRIDGLKQLAYDCGLTNDNAKSFGKLSKTSTWESLLEFHNLEYERVNDIPRNNVASAVDTVDTTDWTNDGSFPVCNFSQNSINFLDWVDISQFVALALATVGLFVLVISLLPSVNPFNLCPVRFDINIQSGAKK
ncbi:MAG: hypothetical protein EAZ78_09025 [Oscillatoriales cyanobacterium]|uniref:Uncharacterized protein n=1 Tax=Microcoleus anatoxicus PTRS2 TaxID=2705321 RepID=A0ABU8YP52_9CYAN|nr:MAG: hypothetical protein EA000_22935 [Oscillatoriales cyanobacterium]TAD95757.1 MAG: hypothetical protein EAZ98_14700 [Oscillatoriales cyanobacterium]TAE03649.1 MAG: hypothetical protein EAZ96_12210 [Oscillatoriales cyanobacterium]TAF04505.1 MAG: hypothetical protein EAZ78_09025 [Oscillatoriales cyanobacterium]TAF42022.1 MAG: hypothetical protein EAZ68_09965 [Oscillatoriales cyanobacterium]